MNKREFIGGAALCAAAGLWIGASLAATCEGLSPQEILHCVNDRLEREFISHDGLLLDYVGEIPTAEEIADLKPNAMGWNSPISNGSMFTGEWLPALMGEGVARKALVEKCVRGLIRMSEISDVPGCIARGTGTDGKSHYPWGSNDQTDPWFLGLCEYCRWPHADPALKAKALERLVFVARALEKNGWGVPCDGPFKGKNCGNLNSKGMPFWGKSRFMYSLKSLHRLTGDAHWSTVYESIKAPALDEIEAGGEVDAKVFTGTYGWGVWIYLSSVQTLARLIEMEENPNDRARMRKGLLRYAERVAPLMKDRAKYANTTERPFKFANWRTGYAWRVQKTRKDAGEVAASGKREILGTRKDYERSGMSVPLCAAAICALSGEAKYRSEILATLRHYDYSTPNISEFFHAAVAASAIWKDNSLYRCEVWRAHEISFESAGRTGDAVELDVVFACGGRKMKRPAFWDGGRTYRVRFAPPEAGRWTWRTECAGEKSLDGLTGAVEAKPYDGTLEIYRRGFVRTEKGCKHFVYDDGTPFLYLGDTHWGFGREAEEDATNAAVRHVETVVKRRVEQGFTVWQSEPIGCSFKLTDGSVDEDDISGLRTLDHAFRTVADAGLVHANAQFFFPSQLKEPLASDTNALRRLARHWVARFGAYPVMWTLGQEVDNDLYYPKQNKTWPAAKNPYVWIARCLHEFDCYRHPLTAHQENVWHVTVTGAGPKEKTATNGGRSVFADPDLAARCGHDWWGIQWSPCLNGPQNVAALKDYWSDLRVAINYEGRYCGLWTMDFGARAQVWISFLSGMRGQGYGAADLWLYRSTYDMKKPSTNEIEVVSVAEKNTPWRRALEFPSANQMRHFRTFMNGIAWWRLEPDFGEGRFFRADPALKGASVAAADGRRLAVAYVFDRTSRATGSFTGLAANANYSVELFNPRTGERRNQGVRKSDDTGTIPLPERPDREDWAFSCKASVRLDISGEKARQTESLYCATRQVLSDGWKFRLEGETAEREVAVPHDWAIERGFLPAGSDPSRGDLPYVGRGFYRRGFDGFTPPPGGRTYLTLDGVMCRSVVRLNGAVVGGCPFGYASETIDVTDKLKGGGNVLEVEAENVRGSSRWYSGSGIFRDVTVRVCGADHVKPNTLFVRTISATAAEAEVAVSFEWRGGVSNLTFKVSKPRLWSPEDPFLYELELFGEKFRYGIRTAHFDPRRGFFLNGVHRQMRGVCLHHDLGPIGAAFDRDVARRQLTLLREMGCDAIRTSHNPPAAALLDLCDEMGFLVMDEAFDMWEKPKGDYSRFWKDWHARDLTEMVCRDRSHPSVVMWSIGNELIEHGEADPSNAVRIARELAAIVKRSDATRPVTFGSYHAAPMDNGCAETVDAFGANYLPFRYAGFLKNHPKTGLVGTETCSTVSSRGEYFFPVVASPIAGEADLPRRRNEGRGKMIRGAQMSGYDLWGPHSNDYPPDVEFTFQEQNPAVYGEFVWTGFDYLGEPDPCAQSGGRSSYFGIFDLAGFPKDRYYLYRSQWRPETPTAHILPHWTWPGREGEVTPVHVYSSGDEAELFLNGRSLGRKRRGRYEYRFVWDDVRYQPGELVVKTWRKGKAWAEDRVRTAGAPARVERTERRFGRLAFVTFAIRDAHGTLCPNVDCTLSFGVRPGARLVALCNGDPSSRENFRGHAMRTFHGLLLAIVDGDERSLILKR